MQGEHTCLKEIKEHLRNLALESVTISIFILRRTSYEALILHVRKFNFTSIANEIGTNSICYTKDLFQPGMKTETCSHAQIHLTITLNIRALPII